VHLVKFKISKKHVKIMPSTGFSPPILAAQDERRLDQPVRNALLGRSGGRNGALN
jgi:hypothetical protein